AAFKPVTGLRTFASRMSPTEKSLLSASLCNSISFPSFNMAKSTSEELDLTIISLFTLNEILSVKPCYIYMALTDGLNNKFITFLDTINFYYRFSFDNLVKFLFLEGKFHFNERLYS